MTWSYSNDPSTSELDEYRFLISDTDEDFPLLQDEEIQYILSTYDGVTSRMYYLYDKIANILAKDVKMSLGPQSEDPTARISYYSSKAAEYRKRLSVSGIKAPTYESPKVFHKGLHSNE